MFHPLQSDEDAPLEALMTARARAALAWGVLQGGLAHMPLEGADHFCYGLIRRALIDALAQSGFPGADARFSSWYSGLEPVTGVTAHAAAPASLVAETLLTELSLSAWEPLAAAAAKIRAAARFERSDRRDRRDASDTTPAFAVEEAARLAAPLANNPDADWPLAVLDRLHSVAAGSPHFAPSERSRQLLDLPSGPIALEQTMPAMPLWALDLAAGSVIARNHPGTRSLPCPGAVRAEALRPELWLRERAILVADAAYKAAQGLTGLLDASYSIVKEMREPVSRLRSTSRAPALYRMLAGFGPLRPIQIEAALTVSKNGVRDLVAALVKAGLAEMTTHRHQALVRAAAPLNAPDPISVSPDETEAIADTNFAEFDAAMADIDRLLARSNASLPEE